MYDGCQLLSTFFFLSVGADGVHRVEGGGGGGGKWLQFAIQTVLVSCPMTYLKLIENSCDRQLWTGKVQHGVHQ